MASLPRLVLSEDDHRPASIHAERTILGAMLVEPLAIVDATLLLKADDFSLDSHRRIYEVMLHLSEVGYAVDIITVSEDLKQAARSSTPSAAWRTSYEPLRRPAPQTLHRKSYVRIVRDKSAHAPAHGASATSA